MPDITENGGFYELNTKKTSFILIGSGYGHF
jgi:hypothetical protein